MRSGSTVNFDLHDAFLLFPMSLCAFVIMEGDLLIVCKWCCCCVISCYYYYYYFVFPFVFFRIIQTSLLVFVSFTSQMRSIFFNVSYFCLFMSVSVLLTCFSIHLLENLSAFSLCLLFRNFFPFPSMFLPAYVIIIVSSCVISLHINSLVPISFHHSCLSSSLLSLTS